jgi:hypothetical protein
MISLTDQLVCRLTPPLLPLCTNTPLDRLAPLDTDVPAACMHIGCMQVRRSRAASRSSCSTVRGSRRAGPAKESWLTQRTSRRSTSATCARRRPRTRHNRPSVTPSSEQSTPMLCADQRKTFGTTHPGGTLCCRGWNGGAAHGRAGGWVAGWVCGHKEGGWVVRECYVGGCV